MTNLFLKLVFICISSVLNGANFESAENNGISVHQYNVVKNDIQNSQSILDKIEDVSSYQDSDDTSKVLHVEEPGNVASLHQQGDSERSSESQNNHLDDKSTIGKRDKKSVKKYVKKNVKSTNNVEDEYPETVQDYDQVENDELEKEYVKQIKEKNGKEFEEDDDEDKNEETDNESEESSQNTNDEDDNEDENSDGQLSDDNRVSGGKSNGRNSGKRRKEHASWLVLQPSNDSLTVVRHKSLVRSDDRDKRRNKKGTRHELDEKMHKIKDLADMNTMKKKLSEEDMYKRILLNLDSDSEEEKQLKKWEKYKGNSNNSDSPKRRKQKKKGKYIYLNDKDVNHGGNRGLINDGDSIYGRTFGKTKQKSPYFADYTELHQGKENKDHVNYNAKRKHKKPLRKLKDNFQDIINNKLSKCKDSSSDDSKQQNSLWSVENKDDENTANKKKTHGNSINNKHGKMQHFLESDSKFQSVDDVVQNKNNGKADSPVQVYRVDVMNRKIIPVFDGDKRKEVHNSKENNDYIAMPYNVSIEFLTDPTAKDMRKRSLKYYNEEFPPLPPPSMYEKFHGGTNNVKNVRMLRDDLSAQDKNYILREEIISDIYNAIKAKNPDLIDTVQVKNSELFNTDNVDLNNFVKSGNDAESRGDVKDKGIYNRRSYDNNVHHVDDELTVSRDNQYIENNNEERENDVKRNANNKNILSELTKMIQKKAAKIVTSTSTEVYTTRTQKTSTDSTESTTCMEFFNEYIGESNNIDANDEKLSTDDMWMTIPSVCMTSNAGKGKSGTGKSKTTQAVKQSTTITSTSRQPTTTPKIDQGKFADMLNGKLADRFFEEISKKVNRSKKMSRELGLCNGKYKPDPTRRCIENGPEELLPLSTLKNIMYKIKENNPEISFLCNAVPSELNSFVNFLIGNTKQKAKECVAVKKQSNFLFKASNANIYDSSLNKENDFNLIPEKQLNLEKSKLNRKTGKSDDYGTEEKENIDEVLVNKVLGNESNKMKSTTKAKDESEFIDDILKDDSNRLVRSDVERSKPADSVQHNDYDYNNMNQYNSPNGNYGNRELERFYYGNGDAKSETKSGYTTFKDKIPDSYENNNFNDDNDNHERTYSHNNNNSNNGGGPLKNLLPSSIFNTISNKIFKNKPAVKEEDVSQFAKAKRQRMSDSMKIKMHNLLYEDGVPEDDEYYDDDDVRVKKDTENSNTYDVDDDFNYDGYDLPFSDENKIADDSNLEDAFVVRTPVEEYNSYYE